MESSTLVMALSQNIKHNYITYEEKLNSFNNKSLKANLNAFLFARHKFNLLILPAMNSPAGKGVHVSC